MNDNGCNRRENKNLCGFVFENVIFILPYYYNHHKGIYKCMRIVNEDGL